MSKVSYYFKLYKDNPKDFRYQIWMVYNRHHINLVKKIFYFLYKITGDFITVHQRPMKAEDYKLWSEEIKNEPKTAIVMQGPLVTTHNFTLETVRLYKKNFPSEIVIVSTWQGEDEDTINKIKAEGALVIQSEAPTVSGIGNINYLLTSTMAGLHLAKELKAEYVIKTRCDYRIYAVNVSEYLRNLLNTFPVKTGYKQKYRIIATSFPTLKYVPYLLADTLQFGHIDDMLLYWNADHDKRSKTSKMIRTVQDLIDEKMNESYICSEYLKKIGREVAWTLEDSWQAFADHFCIVDKESLDLYWYKYEFYSEYRTKQYNGIANDQILSFLEWLNLYQNLANKSQIPTDNFALSRQDYLSNKN